MSNIVEIIKSGNALNILLVGVLLFVLVKSKFLRIHTEHIKLGAHEDERAIMRRQLEYVRITLKSRIRSFPIPIESEKTKKKNQELSDVFEDMIVFNHIKDDKEYISIKQSTIYNKVLSLTDHEFFNTLEFKEICNATVEDIVKTMVRIRRTYKDQ
ncbi:MAG: hypothetical protein IIY33_03900 [Erysipelotrichaceae bacterium]|nr:hypothetical protein [Erysipelotrichaceae bacterium]